MISVTAQAVKHSGRPGLWGAVGVANSTPLTTINLDKTWNVVITTFDGTKPDAAWIIWKKK